ncbi:ABC transporter permease [Streptomyces sp. AJS327]|uniref:ABC transporter permease n=1 Tax=Streptomyces sp. AJS327 TaxID=2545265 RepID=UPI0015DE302D|nr:ABC transporter permease [Streptomyces sp. AJS327]MBA0050176.1 ABC transporter permease [Streptomyces sp. AJS327]
MTMTDTEPVSDDTDEAGPPGKAPPGGLAARRLLGSAALYALFPVLVLASWEWVGRAQLLGGGLFPPFTEVVTALVDWIASTSAEATVYSGTWLEHVLVSTTRIGVGFAIGTVLAVLLGILVGHFASVAKLIDPTVNALRPISVTAWIPLALIIFGIGDKPAYFLTALATFFPIYVNAVDGSRSADAKYTRAAEMLGASKPQVLTRIVLPAALPSIVTGLRVGTAIAWTTVVVTEALGAKSGIGYVLLDAYNQFLFPYVIAAMLTVGALGLACDQLIVLLSRRPLRWASKEGH